MITAVQRLNDALYHITVIGALILEEMEVVMEGFLKEAEQT